MTNKSSQKTFIKKSAPKEPPGAPVCSTSAKEFEVNLGERFNKSFWCHECGDRFPIVELRDKTYFKVPAHKVPQMLHEQRKRDE